MNKVRSIVILAVALSAIACGGKPPTYGVERRLYLPGPETQVWAVAPAADLSGAEGVDPLLQADLVFQQLQTVAGVKAIPVNRVVEVLASLQIEAVQSDEQAAIVCDLLAADGLVVTTVTAFDPYNPPKLGASVQLYRRPAGRGLASEIDPRELSRMAAPPAVAAAPPRTVAMVQAVGMYDASSGSVREKLAVYADGRNDPLGPLGAREYLLSMDRYCGFVYHDLIEQLLLRLQGTEGTESR